MNSVENVALKAKARILIVDDELVVRDSLGKWFVTEGYQVETVSSAREALEAITRQDFALALIDIKMPGMDGMELQQRLHEADPNLLIILMTGYASVETAVQALKRGAYDYITKPFDPDELVHLVSKALEHRQAKHEVARLQESLQEIFPRAEMVGQSPAMKRVYELVEMVAPTDATVLITGESGTGKELVARAIHAASPRRYMPLVVIHCGALTETLLESELFGHERGAFTDARFQKRGLFEMADGGTVFLDEIGEMVPALQAKLLRFLEEKTFKRVGGTSDIRVDVRVVAATNRNLEEEVAKGRFRSDLYYRLNVLPISLPPLRSHPEDIPALVDFFIDGFNREFKKNILGATPAALKLLQGYGWPGNVRELRNVIERAVLLAEGPRLEPRDFAALTAAPAPGTLELPPQGIDLEELERSFVIQALRRAGGNQTKAAALLGLNRDQIRYRIEKFGISVTP
ncbi:MAG TPA: sigma-54 dependent transcriptional regulator [Candidatus Xenobia bacterium]|nr:sigma-54 dependent transcriptional regulator [Candidatus Xenobia bacterium]